MSKRQDHEPVLEAHERRLLVRAAQESRGGRRTQNDDRVGMFVPDDPAVLALKGAAFVICDGVSAADAGGEAADTCVRGFLSDYFAVPDSWSVENAARNVLSSLNGFLRKKGGAYRDPQRGFLCTLSALVLKARTASVFHIGDSRVYRARGGEIRQLTQDHKLQVSETQSYLARAMGLDLDVAIDHLRMDVEEGDVFLMATDGLYACVDDARMLAACHEADLEQAAADLVQAALAAGSDDNVSCQLIRVIRLPSSNQLESHRALVKLPFPPPLAPGMVIDGYRVLRRIHESPRSQLYAVRDEENHEVLAMKTPSEHHEDDQAYLDRFVMEPWIGSRVRSPYVIASVSPKRRQTFLYHLQQYVEGMTLEQWMRTYPQRDVKDCLRIVEQVARGLAALHRRQIVHRDLKPDNVMITPDGQVKLIDLGACFVSGVAEMSVQSIDEGPQGTAHYGAPELRMGEAVLPSSDQYSLGVLSYELLTGHLPYGDDAARARTPSAVARLRYVPAYQHNPLVPLWMNAALRKALRGQPQLRYAELSEFVHDLSQPNPDFLNERAVPLIERSPLRFWQGMCVCLLMLNLVSWVHCSP